MARYDVYYRENEKPNFNALKRDFEREFRLKADFVDQGKPFPPQGEDSTIATADTRTFLIGSAKKWAYLNIGKFKPYNGSTITTAPAPLSAGDASSSQAPDTTPIDFSTPVTVPVSESNMLLPALLLSAVVVVICLFSVSRNYHIS